MEARIEEPLRKRKALNPGAAVPLLLSDIPSRQFLSSLAMASACSRIAQRTSISSIKSAIKSNIRATSSRSATNSSVPAKSISSPLCRSFLSRTPSELGCVQSMLPLHSAVAAARMTSCLSTTSRSCRALSQELGLSVPR